jgi:hypothetical protein
LSTAIAEIGSVGAISAPKDEGRGEREAERVVAQQPNDAGHDQPAGDNEGGDRPGVPPKRASVQLDRGGEEQGREHEGEQSCGIEVRLRQQSGQADGQPADRPGQGQLNSNAVLLHRKPTLAALFN